MFVQLIFNFLKILQRYLLVMKDFFSEDFLGVNWGFFGLLLLIESIRDLVGLRVSWGFDFLRFLFELLFLKFFCSLLPVVKCAFVFRHDELLVIN
jgi:hypothetical protein